MWENWKGPSSGEWFHTFAIISSHANELVTDIHDRMPVILAPEITSHGLSYELATKAVFSSRSRYPNVRSRLEVLS